MFRAYKTTEPGINPPTDKVFVWFDVDGTWKFKIDDGTVSPLGSTGGGGLTPTNTAGTPVSLNGATAITPAGVQRELLYIKSNSGLVTNGATPQIAAGATHGQEILLVGVSDTDKIRFVDGAGLTLNGDCVFKNRSTLLLFWDGATWVEGSRNDK